MSPCQWCRQQYPGWQGHGSLWDFHRPPLARNTRLVLSTNNINWEPGTQVLTLKITQKNALIYLLIHVGDGSVNDTATTLEIQQINWGKLACMWWGAHKSLLPPGPRRWQTWFALDLEHLGPCSRILRQWIYSSQRHLSFKWSHLMVAL